MDGIGTDETAIIEVLSKHNAKQRSEIKKLFKFKEKEVYQQLRLDSLQN